MRWDDRRSGYDVSLYSKQKWCHMSVMKKEVADWMYWMSQRLKNPKTFPQTERHCSNICHLIAGTGAWKHEQGKVAACWHQFRELMCSNKSCCFISTSASIMCFSSLGLMLNDGHRVKVHLQCIAYCDLLSCMAPTCTHACMCSHILIFTLLNTQACSQSTHSPKPLCGHKFLQLWLKRQIANKSAKRCSHIRFWHNQINFL